MLIRDAERIKEPSGEELVPVSDGTDTPKCVALADVAALAESSPAISGMTETLKTLTADADTEGSVLNIVRDGMNRVLGAEDDTYEKITVHGGRRYTEAVNGWEEFN